MSINVPALIDSLSTFDVVEALPYAIVWLRQSIILSFFSVLVSVFVFVLLSFSKRKSFKNGFDPLLTSQEVIRVENETLGRP